ncbi:MAG: nucleoside hydrolase [Candidatus Flexifilum sp.]|jgi:purine nucleosidase|nr:MAG: nucleoside hydrolase [Phototrophicales bacterium]
MSTQRPFIIDTDTASDDAVALMMALRCAEVDVKAITVVGGNVPLEQGVQNALFTVEQCGCQIPVYAGCAQPLIRPLETAQSVHGMDGMGDIGLLLRGRKPASGHAVDVLIDTIQAYEGEVTLVTLGPLTNLALALLRAPQIAGQVGRYVMMGGTSDAIGNVSPVAEYNIWADPEAARIVFQSGLPIEMVGWDISRKYATFNRDQARMLEQVGTDLARLAVAIQTVVDTFATSTTQLDGFDLPDPIAMAVALEPQIATRVIERFVTVVTDSAICRGQTVVDHLGLTGHPANARVVIEAARAQFIELLKRSLS